MSHLGRRLSALIDGELDRVEVDRVLDHLARCGWCQEEAAALRALKRRMNALGESAAAVGLAGLTGRLMNLGAGGTGPQLGGGWGASALADHWPASPAADTHPQARAGRYLLAAAAAVFLAGLGTAAFIAGGDPSAQAPAPNVTPAVDVYLLQHATFGGLFLTGPAHQPLPTPAVGRATGARPGSAAPSKNRSSPLP